MTTCHQCQAPFHVTDADRAFYDKVSPLIEGKKYLIPEPTLCPPCRQQRRISYRNERKLYKRSCDLTGKPIISMYSVEKPFPVYSNQEWWGDNWNALDYGRDFDFSRTFFDQFRELCNEVPHFPLAVLSSTMENSDFCNHAGYLKNCYLIYNTDYSEQCLYGKGMNRCFDCVDGFKIYDCQSCYECSNCTNCQFCTYLIDSHNSSDCHFSANLSGCKNCFGSVNLRNKEYCFFNEQLTPEAYSHKVHEWRSTKTPSEIWGEFSAFRKQSPMKWMQEKNTEHCSGDYLVEAKDCESCFDAEYLEQSKYCYDLKKGDKVSFQNYDLGAFGVGIEASYEGGGVGYNVSHVLFCENVWDSSSDVYYSQFCMQSQRVFGSCSLRHGKNMVMNKAYSAEEYDRLVARIIDHMKETGEWGEFFPIQHSPLGYNESVAMEYFPLTKEDVLKRGWSWYEEKEPDYSEVSKKIPAAKLPTQIDDIPDDILNWAIECEQTGRLFKIQKLELDFYRRMKLPIPRVHPDLRHAMRFQLRNPRHLWDRSCDKCGKGIQTSYSSERPEKVYCEECYLKEVY